MNEQAALGKPWGGFFMVRALNMLGDNYLVHEPPAGDRHAPVSFAHITLCPQMHGFAA